MTTENLSSPLISLKKVSDGFECVSDSPTPEELSKFRALREKLVAELFENQNDFNKRQRTEELNEIAVLRERVRLEKEELEIKREMARVESETPPASAEKPKPESNVHTAPKSHENRENMDEPLKLDVLSQKEKDELRNLIQLFGYNEGMRVMKDEIEGQNKKK